MKESAIMGILLIYILLVFNACVLEDKERDEGLRALSQCKESQRWVDRFTIQMVTTSREISPVHESEPSRKTEVTIKKMGSCLSISGVQNSLNRKVGPSEFHIVVNNKVGVWNVHGIHEQPKNVSGSRNTAKALDGCLTDLFSSGAILEGYVIGIDSKCLVDLVLEADNLAVLGKETINDSLCLRIMSKTKYGNIEMWLDEKNGYLPRRYVFKRGPDDLCSDGKKLRETNYYGAGKGSLRGVFVDSDSTVLDQVEIGKERGSFFIKKGRITGRASRSNGDTIGYEITYDRINFDPNPHLSEEDFIINLPNGMAVFNEDDPDSGVAYEWRDGRIVPAHSDSFASTEGKWANTSGFLVLIWLVGGVVLLAGSLWYIWRYKMARG